LHPASQPSKRDIECRIVECFQCGSELEVAQTAVSTMCRRCSSHVDLSDYHVTQTLTKSFRTHGLLVIEQKGYLLNTEAVVGDAIIKGRLIGRITAHRTLEIHSTARIEGTFTAGQLIVPTGQCFRWPEAIRVSNAEIRGELAGSICASGTVRLKSSARCFGDLEAANLVVEEGAIFVGEAKIREQIGGAPQLSRRNQSMTRR
jgi:cytoskeletal protein CcmA (bactofilin family)